MPDIKENNNRIAYIDFIKVIGIAAIILAHVNPPNILFTIRSFDVPLMVIMSSLLAKKSYQKFDKSGRFPGLYIWERIKRLVIPTWIFLIIYFAVELLLTKMFREWSYYAYSFGLTMYGIGYVWVILIYIYSALLVPLFYKIKPGIVSSIVIALIYIIYEVAYYNRLGTDNRVILTTIYYIIPYGVITYLGFNYTSFSKLTKRIIMIISFALFLGMGIYYRYIYGYFHTTQIAKYPPRIYFIGFGVGVSFLLLGLCERFSLKLYELKIVKFISKNSLWIFLWHILVLQLYAVLRLPEKWYVKYLIVFAAALLITFVVESVKHLCVKLSKTLKEEKSNIG